MVKINPMAAWTRRQVWRYLKDQRLPHNPLYDLGYSSIGCAPCTRMRFEGEAERAGRWAGLSKWECGIQSTDDDALRSGAEPAVLGP
jgi:phosphoadenosine phosphosulfate reductase